MHVLKIGGSELASPVFASALAQVIAGFSAPPILVHGGGKEIAELQAKLGLAVAKVEGLRVTDARSLAVAEMVLSGRVNKRLVRHLLAAGVDAIGLSGVDGGLLRCAKKLPSGADFGFVGEITSVRAGVVTGLREMGFAVVISPISLGPDGEAYNVNADEAASAVARAIKAEMLDFVSNVPGVMRDGQVIDELTVAQCEALIAQGVVREGMIPKLRAAAAAVQQGVPQARIVDLTGLVAGTGTVVRP
jgi:acetylglutamate kinase